VKHYKPYLTKSGRMLNKPAAGWLTMVINEGSDTGFCLACAEDTDGIEPDAGACLCPQCGEAKLYGAEELLLMGLYFDEDLEPEITAARNAGYIRG
jgi:hypothetical protein